MWAYRLAAFCLLAAVTVVVSDAVLGVSLAGNLLQARSLLEELRAERELHECLDVTNQELQRRIAIKEALIEELVAGRTTLAAVTDQFLLMNQGRPEYMAVIRSTYPGRTDHEKTTQNVIGYLDGVLYRYPPVEQAEVRTRLGAELRSLGTAPQSATKK